MIKKIICLDAGHGGTDPGACANKLIEKAINLKVVLELGKLLEDAAWKVIYTRKTDKFLELHERVAIGKANKVEVFISVHHNAGGGIGYDVIHEVNSKGSKLIADAVAAEFKELGRPKHNVFSKWNESHTDDWFGVLRNDAPCTDSLITEYGFVDTKDSKAFDTDAELKLEAAAIFHAIEKVWKKL